MKKYMCTVGLLLGVLLPVFASSDEITASKDKVKRNSSTAEEMLSMDKKLDAFTQSIQQELRTPEKLGEQLLNAVIDNNIPRVQELIVAGADVNYTRKKVSVLGMALKKCWAQRDTRALDALLDSENLKYAGEDASCCLSELAATNQQYMVDKLLNKLPISPDSSCKKLVSPLFVSLYNRNWATATTLLKHGASLNGFSKTGYTPLQILIFTIVNYGYTSQQGEEEKALLSLMVTREPSLLVKKSVKDEVTPIIIAAYFGAVDLIDKMWQEAQEKQVDMDAFLNATNQQGENALFYAIKQENKQTILKLTQMGTKPDYPNIYGFTPLDYAQDKGLYEEINYMRKFCK